MGAQRTELVLLCQEKSRKSSWEVTTEYSLKARKPGRERRRSRHNSKCTGLEA